jgi:uncharacterized protein (DUF58 family)
MKWISGTIVLLLLGLLLKLTLLVYAMYVLGGILLLSRFFTQTWMANLIARRSCNVDLAEIGESARVEVELENKGIVAIPWLLIEDALPRDAMNQAPRRMQAEGPRLALTQLARGESVTLVDYEVKFLMRGYYQLGPLLAETGDVFGLHRRFRVMAEPHFVMVLPKVLPLEGYNLASRRPMGEIRVTHRLFEDPTRLASIRPYQPGDPLNRIHWRATARTGEIHCRVYENSRVAGATFLLDFHLNNYQDANGAASAELAIMAVAALANAVFLMGQQIGFASNGRDAADRIREEGWKAEFLTRDEAIHQANVVPANTRLRPLLVETGKGEERFRWILETLARLEHTDGLDFSQMVGEVDSRIPRDATVVAVLRKVTPSIAAALGGLVLRGFLVTTIVVASGAGDIPDWARAPDWAQMLLAQGIDFHFVNSEESITNLCAQAIVK